MEMMLFNEGGYSADKSTLLLFLERKKKSDFIQSYICISVLLVLCTLIYANLRLIYRHNWKMYDVGYGQIQVVLDSATEVITKIMPFAQIHTM